MVEMKKSILDLAVNSKKKALSFYEKENFGFAFSHFLLAIQFDPSIKSQVKDEFSTSLCLWGRTLEKQNRINDIFSCYKNAIEIFPENEIVLNNLGAHLLRLGLYKEAENYFNKSLATKANYLEAWKNLENISNLVVERWHFKMLNDELRNEAYREAIIKKIQSGHEKVLDIGTGTGLLSLFAVQGGAKKVYACDESDTMINLAQDVLENHRQTDKITLFKKNSKDLNICEDITERVSLVITETFDCGLLGENVLKTLVHAWDNLLLSSSEGGVVLPMAACLYCVGISCEEYAKQFFTFPSENLNLFGLKIRTCEGYDTCDFKNVKFKELTERKILFNIDFNDCEQLRKLLSEEMDVTVQLTPVVSGKLEAFMVWFELQLDEDIKINTFPNKTYDLCWEQAVFPPNKLTYVDVGTEIKVRAYCKDGRLDLQTVPGNMADLDSQFLVSPQAIKYINNKSYHNLTRGVIKTLVNESRESLCLFECSPFPVFSLNFLLQRNKLSVNKCTNDRLICVVKNIREKDLVVTLAQLNSLKLENIKVYIEEDIENVFNSLQPCDFIFCDVIESTGEMKESVLSRTTFLKKMLKPGGIIFPQQITVIGQVIDSRWLRKVSSVMNNDVTSGYNIKEFINRYKVSHHLDLQLSVIDKQIHSEPKTLLELSLLTEDEREHEVELTRLKFENLTTGVPYAVTYWYQLHFVDQMDYMTLDTLSHVNQAAFVIQEKPVRAGELIHVNVSYSGGILRIQ